MRETVLSLDFAFSRMAISARVEVPFKSFDLESQKTVELEHYRCWFPLEKRILLCKNGTT